MRTMTPAGPAMMAERLAEDTDVGYPLEVSAVVHETRDAITLRLVPSDEHRQLFDYTPGQFLTLRIPGNPAVARCYSLSSTPKDAEMAVTVKRTHGGYASNWLCDHAKPGLRLMALPPTGRFVLSEPSTPLLFVAAGSGITPVISMITAALAETSRDIALCYANNDLDSVIFGAALADLATQFAHRLSIFYWLDSEQGLPTIPGLAQALPTDTAARDVYLCGPAAFMEMAVASARSLGASDERIHREVYTSLTDDPFRPRPVAGGIDSACSNEEGRGCTLTVEIAGENHTLPWPPQRPLLEVLLDNGIDAPFVCREGNCGACVFTLTRGSVELPVNDALDDHELNQGLRLACQAIPTAEQVAAVFDV